MQAASLPKVQDSGKVSLPIIIVHGACVVPLWGGKLLSDFLREPELEPLIREISRAEKLNLTFQYGHFNRLLPL
jgi:hypothetical protein